MTRKWFAVALCNLLVATLIGALLRFAFVEELSWMKFRFFLHAHSHVAMLGWIYLALYGFIVLQFIQPDSAKGKVFNRLFWVTQLSVVGMLLSFPVQGYGPVSITFSTLHIVCSYFFVWKAWPFLTDSNSFATRMLRFALLFMVLSTFGLWGMGPIIATGMKGSALYYMAVQFYLHFQFNGWFIFAALALLFKQFENRDIPLPQKASHTFLVLLILSCVLTYALAVAWSQPLLIVFITNSLGVLVQLVALFFLYRIVRPLWNALLSKFEGQAKGLLQVAMLSFTLKIITQAAVALPFVAEAAYTIRNYVIGFIHLILLGAISTFIFALAYQEGILKYQSATVKYGILTFVCGILLSEFILLLQGTMLWAAMGFLPQYYEVIFSVSALMPLGILITLLGLLTPSQD